MIKMNNPTAASVDGKIENQQLKKTVKKYAD
jgi:hypothetical protein